MIDERQLARMILHQGRRNHTRLIHIAEVTSIQLGPPPTLTVALSGGGGTLSGIHYQSWYFPKVNDYVILLHTGKMHLPGGADWLVIGRSAAQAALLPSQPMFSGYASASQSLVAGNTLIAVDTVLIDTANGFDTTTHAYTIPVAGWYRISGQVKMGNYNFEIESMIYKNGSPAKFGGQTGPSAYSGSVLSALMSFAAGDTVELWAGATGAALTTFDGPELDNYLDIEFKAQP